MPIKNGVGTPQYWRKNGTNLQLVDGSVTELVDKAGSPLGGGGAVDSVNGKTGEVILNQDEILDGTTYKQFSQTEKAKLAGIAEEAGSPSVMTGGVVTAGTNAGTFKVSALTAYLRTTDSVTGAMKYVTLAEQDNQAITSADTTYFISLNYNSGNPTITLTTSNPYNTDKRNIPIGKVMKDSSDNIHYISGGYDFQDGVRKLHARAKILRSFELDGGSVISYSGTNNFAMNEGIAFGGINPYTLLAYNSATTTFTPVYGDGGTGFTKGTPRNTIDYEHYDNGSGTLGNVGVSKYGCHWVYRHIDDGDVYVVYGTTNGSQAEAETSPAPNIPAFISDFGLLIGRIVAPQAGGSFASVQMVGDTFFSGTAVSVHNSLGGLQGGTTDEYYHQTFAEHTISTQEASASLDGYLSSTDWNIFNGKSPAVGSSSITIVGTIGTGVWNATAIADGKIASANTWNGTTNYVNDTEYNDGNITGTATINRTNGKNHKATVTGAVTVTFSLASAGFIQLKLINGGANTVTWGNTIKWSGGSAPTLTSAGVDFINIFFDGTTYYGDFGLDFS